DQKRFLVGVFVYLAAQVTGQQQAGSKLSKLRRLQAETAYRYPCLVSSHVPADNKHGNEQQDDKNINQRRCRDKKLFINNQNTKADNQRSKNINRLLSVVCCKVKKTGLFGIEDRSMDIKPSDRTECKPQRDSQPVNTSKKALFP